MKFIPLCFLSCTIMISQGCGYGDPVLRVDNPETFALIDKYEGKKATSLRSAHETEGWFFIPQIITRKRDNKAWIAIRVYSRDKSLNFKINGLDVAFDADGVSGENYLDPDVLQWIDAPDGWFYTVERLKVYRYTDLDMSRAESVRVAFDVDAESAGRQYRRREEFLLQVNRVRHSGW